MDDIAKNVIVEASQGDIDAFEKIYRHYFHFVANVAFRVVNRREDAQDVTQEVFVTIYDNLKDFRFASSFKTWVYRITVNAAINYAKRAAKHRNNMVEYTQVFDLKSPDPGAVEKMDSQISEKEVQALLNMLNPDQRACIVLRGFEGLSYEEISKALQMPINTVRSRIKRAREAMLALKKEVIKHDV
ncbi:MAG: hypothetical protein A2Z88_00555 [Omnitrophica WOR_2 bacterium GWA2_47_8]|nr:MAG: hypothetical protein A2Z88_00555 [Omnitrophica WOR_2 bacterium GWA2_47_8]